MAKRTVSQEIDRPEASESSNDQRRPGRPPGSPNREYLMGTRNPGQCPKCGCTDSRDERKDIIPLCNDPEFSHVELIRCKCSNPDCNQWRIDRQKCNPVS